jgi:ABC-type multidrug transport system fused ATPase/permease subunit
MIGAIKNILELIKLIGNDPRAHMPVARLKRITTGAFVLLVFTEILEIIQLYPIKYFVDGIIQRKSFVYLMSIVGIMIGLDIIVRIVSNFMNKTRHFAEWQNYNLLFGFGHTKQLSMDTKWHVEHGTSDKESMIGKNIQRIDNLVSSIVYEAIPLFVRIIITVVVLMFVNIWIAILATIVVAGYGAVLSYNFKRNMKELDEEFHTEWRAMHERGTELSTRARLLKQFGEDSRFADNFREEIESYYQNDIPRSNDWRRFQRRAEYVLMFAFPIMYVLLALQYASSINVGSVVLISTWLQRIFVNLYRYRNVQKYISEGMTPLNEYITLLSTTPEIDQPDKPVEPDSSSGEVRLESVSFYYSRQSAAILKDINLLVKPGSSVAFVGPSGSGKSTLALLIAREYDPCTGKVLLDGISLKDHDYYRLRLDGVNMISQDVQLINGTIADNIRLGNPSFSDRDVVKAAKMAHAHEFIVKLSDGYNTSVGENGVRLSGGQKQRVAIARAFLRKPSVLIMDEATSALDAESQHLVQRTVDEIMNARESTIIIIAHRLSTVRSADLVCYMEDGCIVEQGTHDKLMELKGKYHDMVTREIGNHLD